MAETPMRLVTPIRPCPFCSADPTRVRVRKVYGFLFFKTEYATYCDNCHCWGPIESTPVRALWAFVAPYKAKSDPMRWQAGAQDA